MKIFAKITSIFLALMALVHALRIAMGWEVHVGGWGIPLWASVIFLLVDGGLAVGLWKESRSLKP